MRRSEMNVLKASSSVLISKLRLWLIPVSLAYALFVVLQFYLRFALCSFASSNSTAGTRLGGSLTVFIRPAFQFHVD